MNYTKLNSAFGGIGQTNASDTIKLKAPRGRLISSIRIQAALMTDASSSKVEFKGALVDDADEFKSKTDFPSSIVAS